MTRIALIIGGALIMAGAAFAGTFSSLGSKDEPSIQQAPASATTTTRQEDRAQERELRGRENEPGEDVRGRENEPGEDARGRENEAGEDLRGPCDEAEHASDPRCTGASPAGANDDRSGHSGRDDSGRDDDGHSGRGRDGGGDDGGNSGHGGGGDDD
jgi:hypothetical protein